MYEDFHNLTRCENLKIGICWKWYSCWYEHGNKYLTFYATWGMITKMSATKPEWLLGFLLLQWGQKCWVHTQTSYWWIDIGGSNNISALKCYVLRYILSHPQIFRILHIYNDIYIGKIIESSVTWNLSILSNSVG